MEYQVKIINPLPHGAGEVELNQLLLNGWQVGQLTQTPESLVFVLYRSVKGD